MLKDPTGMNRGASLSKKEPYRYERRYFTVKIHGHFLPSVSCFATRCLLVTARELWWMNQE
jgi:hypothetical protein